MTASRWPTSSPTTRSTTRPTARTTATATTTTAAGTAASRDRPTIRRSCDLRDRMRRNCDGDAAALAGHADAADGRRDRPHPERQQQRLLPGQRDSPGSTGSGMSARDEAFSTSSRGSLRLRQRLPLLRQTHFLHGERVARRHAGHHLVAARRQADGAKRTGTTGCRTRTRRSCWRGADDLPLLILLNAHHEDVRFQDCRRLRRVRAGGCIVDTARGLIEPDERSDRPGASRDAAARVRPAARGAALMSVRYALATDVGRGVMRRRRGALSPVGAGADRLVAARRAERQARSAMARSQRRLVRADEPTLVAVGRAAIRFALADDGMRVPDPAARAQRRDVHGPSLLIDPRAYDWQTRDWRGRPWAGGRHLRAARRAPSRRGHVRRRREQARPSRRARRHGDRADAGRRISPAPAAGAMTASCSMRRTRLRRRRAAQAPRRCGARARPDGASRRRLQSLRAGRELPARSTRRDFFIARAPDAVGRRHRLRPPAGARLLHRERALLARGVPLRRPAPRRHRPDPRRLRRRHCSRRSRRRCAQRIDATATCT